MGLSKNRIDEAFAKLKTKSRCAFIPYICAGDPNLEISEKIIYSLVKSGADILEIGVPFSDPLADGIANQEASFRSLEAGNSMKQTLNLISRIRKNVDIPIILYSYLNPIYIYGFDKFLKDSKEVGVDGLLVLDLPVDEMVLEGEFRDSILSNDQYFIQLITPTSSEDRIKLISENATGFIYYISRTGVTGERSDIAANISDKMSLIKKYSDLPVVLGFGISNSSQANEVSNYVDGVVVGSAIVNVVKKYCKNEKKLIIELEDFTSDLSSAVHG